MAKTPESEGWSEAGERTESGERSESDGGSAAPFDPSGLDLARSIAEAVSHTLPPVKPRKPRQRRPAASGRSRSDPTALGDALGEVISDQGWSTEVSVHALLGRWASLVGDAVAQHSRPESFSLGVVTVRTDSTAWASQLRLMTPQLLAKLNEALGQGTIKRIAVKGPDAPSWKHGIRTVRDGRGPRDTYG